jgi:hypothetical protein
LTEVKPSLARRLFNVLRWPVALGFLIFSGIFFIIGLLNSLGYQGTTNLRPSKDDAEWRAFQSSFQGIKGAPFMWKSASPAPVDGIINFDKRLVASLNYLKNSPKDLICGWNGTHESLELDIESGKFTDLIVPPSRTMSLSTLYRGVGVRFSKADYVKCTIEPIDPTICPEKQPRSFTKIRIPLTTAEMGSIKPTETYNPACKVTCATDYYPRNPIDKAGDPSEITPPKYSTAVTNLVPAAFNSGTQTPIEFDYQQINSAIHRAAAQKIILLSVELMNIDQKGCANSSAENTGSKRLIPITLILPDWILSDLGQGWQSMRRSAVTKFPFNFQNGSPLAGLTHDPNLNTKGLHYNY